MMINNDYLEWFSAEWMRRNMCASCRILHDPIVFRNLLWWGNMLSPSIGCASTRVYVRKATDGWIFFRSYLDFSYVRTGSDDSIYDTSITKVVNTPCRNSPYYLAYMLLPLCAQFCYANGDSPYAKFLAFLPVRIWGAPDANGDQFLMDQQSFLESG